ncbi:MAG: thioredoxin protein [Subtercola sp.]|nr:thioredoxin protein [Subtercola sp.]
MLVSMVNRLAAVISPYLRSHADNPVDWFAWGEDAFAEAKRRDVPVLVSIGYSTCHWCHVMARESFSDPVLAAQLNDNFVAIKVDREEHPEVDAFYLAAAGAFTQNLGWPLNVFTTPDARPFFGGTYSPPIAVQGNPSFAQVLGAVTDAWLNRRADVDDTAEQLTTALAAAGEVVRGAGGAGADADDSPGSIRAAVPTPEQFARVTSELEAYEDAVHGGFGGAPKFPVAPVLSFLLQADAPLALRTLKAMAASDLRDPVEGGFFRYATRADWSDPHYERMLYDNALLLDAYTTAAELPDVDDGSWATAAATGIAEYLIAVLRVDGGGFASAQDSESIVAGRQSEGGYYALDAEHRAVEVPPKLDQKILTGWNGLAIGALAHAAVVFDNDRWMTAARSAADYLLEHHLRADGTLLRASLGGRTSDARSTLEDYGMLALGLGRLAAATGEQDFLRTSKRLVDATLQSGATAVFAVPGGGDPVLASHGLLSEGDVSEGAYPSGLSAMATAAFELFLVTGEGVYLTASRASVVPITAQALSRPIGFGATLELLYRLGAAAEPTDTTGADGSATHSLSDPS